jgi:putative MATE family efflux protein
MSNAAPAKFTVGSTMRHVLVMTATASVGLLAVFLVDMLNLFYISLLGIQELAAAVGFASTLMFFTLSISIGLTIPSAALVGRCLGRGNRQEAAEMGGAAMVFMAVATIVTSAAILPFLEPLLSLLGARGETLELARRFLLIVIPSTPLMALGMCATGILRGAGDARRAMYVTLFSAVATAILDPILIFALDLGLDGAAISTVLSRVVMLVTGWYGTRVVHNLLAFPTRARLRAAAKPFFDIGLPAVLTQLATPVGNAYLMGALAQFGDDAVAGMAVIGRLVPVCFVALFACSGAVGPILAQNLGFDGTLRPPDRGYFRRQRSGPRGDRLFLLRRRGAVPVRRGDLHRQRGLQQPRQAGLLDHPELGALDLGRHSLRLHRRGLVWSGGRAGGFGPRRRLVRHCRPAVVISGRQPRGRRRRGRT